MCNNRSYGRVQGFLSEAQNFPRNFHRIGRLLFLSCGNIVCYTGKINFKVIFNFLGFDYVQFFLSFKLTFVQERTIEGLQGLDITNQNIFLILSCFFTLFVFCVLFYLIFCLTVKDLSNCMTNCIMRSGVHRYIPEEFNYGNTPNAHPLLCFIENF